MMIKRRRSVPKLNTTSTADISFMLLIFFLVTSSMDSDKGLPRQLPSPQNEQVEQLLKVKKRNVMEISINADNQLFCDGEPCTTEELLNNIVRFVDNHHDDPSLPEKSLREVNLLGKLKVSDRHVLSITVDRATSYDAYFQMQNAIARAYYQLRNDLAQKRFGRRYQLCNAEQREAIAMVYPQRISENIPEGGTQ